MVLPSGAYQYLRLSGSVHYNSKEVHDRKKISQHWIGTILLVLASMFWVVGTLYGNNSIEEGTSNITGSAIQLLASSLIAAIMAAIRGECTSFEISAVTTKGWAGLAYLIVMGSLVAFLAFNWLVRVQPPAIVSTHTFVNPVVAIFMGWLIVGEKISTLQMIALTGVLISVLIIQLKKPKEASP